MKRLLCIMMAVAMFVSGHAQDRICPAASPKGHLMLVGGGQRPDEMMDRFFELGGGKDKPFVVICTASRNPEPKKKSMIEEFHRRGVENVTAISPTRAQCNDPGYLKLFDGVKGVFFSGGSQTLIADTLRGTALHRRLMQIYNDGGIIGGTSAGAGMMSDPMIAGNSVDGSSVQVKDIRADLVYVAPGMGFLPYATIDQHFMARSRENRAFSVALQYPQKPVIGIDESTALLVSGGRHAEVMGVGAVMVMEVRKKTVKHSGNGLLGTSGMTVRILLPGDKYTLK